MRFRVCQENSQIIERPGQRPAGPGRWPEAVKEKSMLQKTFTRIYHETKKVDDCLCLDDVNHKTILITVDAWTTDSLEPPAIIILNTAYDQTSSRINVDVTPSVNNIESAIIREAQEILDVEVTRYLELFKK